MSVTALRSIAVRRADPTPRTAAAPSSQFELARLQQHAAVTRRPVRAGEYVYRAGQPLTSLSLVHAGVLKSTIASSDGREKVTGFHLHGAWLGLEAMSTGVHACDVVALEDGEVWDVGHAELMAACSRVPALQCAFATAMAAEILSERQWMLTMSTLGAEQRVAALLLDFGARLHALGFSASRFMLRMTRAEIGSFLGLKLETVTRAMTQLDERGLIGVQRREIELRDPAGLRALIETPPRALN